MKIKVRLVLYNDEKMIKTLITSLLPDNVKIPNGMRIFMDTKGNQAIVIIDVDSRKVKIDTLISTLDEILEISGMIENSFKMVM